MGDNDSILLLQWQNSERVPCSRRAPAAPKGDFPPYLSSLHFLSQPRLQWHMRRGQLLSAPDFWHTAPETPGVSKVIVSFCKLTRWQMASGGLRIGHCH